MTWMPLLWLVLLFFAVVQYNFVCFYLLPRWAARLSHGRQRDVALRLLEVLAWLPGLSSERVRVNYHLGIAYSVRGLFKDAERQFRLVLAVPNTLGKMADIHRRLADVLDAQGREEDALLEFSRAAKLATQKSDVSSLLAQGTLLKRSHQYAEAYAVYETALQAAQTLPSSAQAEIMVKMGLAAFDDGRPDLTITWMEKAIAAQARGTHLRSAHTMAGIAYGNRSQFARAIAHARHAAALAEHDGAYGQAGNALSTVALNQLKQGDIAASLQTCADIERRSWTNRTSLVIQADCLESLGQYEDAYASISHALNLDKMKSGSIPHYQRRQEKVVIMALARNLALQGRSEEAWQCLQDAALAFQTDEKLRFMCDAYAAWILALLGHREEADGKIALAESGVERYSQDQNCRTGGLFLIGRSWYTLGGYELAAERWQAYLNAEPYPVWQPRGYFFLGDCLERLGDAEGARQAYRQATIVPIADAEAGDAAWPPAPSLAAGHATGRFVDTHEARLARQRLEQVQ